jgi:hypothetical protein
VRDPVRRRVDGVVGKLQWRDLGALRPAETVREVTLSWPWLVLSLKI